VGIGDGLSDGLDVGRLEGNRDGKDVEGTMDSC